MTEPLKCPFCPDGGEQKVITKVSGFRIVECLCGIRTSFQHWNTRAEPTIPTALLEKMVETLEFYAPDAMADCERNRTTIGDCPKKAQETLTAYKEWKDTL